MSHLEIKVRKGEKTRFYHIHLDRIDCISVPDSDTECTFKIRYGYVDEDLFPEVDEIVELIENGHSIARMKIFSTSIKTFDCSGFYTTYKAVFLNGKNDTKPMCDYELKLVDDKLGTILRYPIVDIGFDYKHGCRTTCSFVVPESNNIFECVGMEVYIVKEHKNIYRIKITQTVVSRSGTGFSTRHDAIVLETLKCKYELPEDARNKIYGKKADYMSVDEAIDKAILDSWHQWNVDNIRKTHESIMKAYRKIEEENMKINYKNTTIKSTTTTSSMLGEMEKEYREKKRIEERDKAVETCDKKLRKEPGFDCFNAADYGVAYRHVTIERVKIDDPWVIMFWSDKTVTKAKCDELDSFDPEVGIMICICKKLFRTPQNLRKILNNFTKDYYKELKEETKEETDGSDNK